MFLGVDDHRGFRDTDSTTTLTYPEGRNGWWDRTSGPFCLQKRVKGLESSFPAPGAFNSRGKDQIDRFFAFVADHLYLFGEAV